MGKWLLRALVALAILVPLVLAGFFVGMRYVGPTPVQQAALREMTAPNPPVQGHDASDAVWLLDYDVPVEKWPEVAAATRRYLDAKARGPVAVADPRAAFPRYPEPPPEAPCQRRDDGCLAWVAEHRAEVGAMLDANKPGADAVRALAAYDGFRMGVPASLALEFPRVNVRRPLVLAEIAYRFASGERLSAVESVCRDIAGWRRIGGNSDHLLVSMLGVHNVQADLKLLADMLAKMPKETDLPEDCGAALESSAPYEFELCPAVRYEYAAVRAVREAARHAPASDAGPPHWAIDWNNFEAMAAQAYAPYCAAAAGQAARADQRLVPPPLPSCGKWRRLADPYGCVLADIGGMGFNRYFDRRADQAQMLALARTVVWLRTAAEGPAEVEAVLAQRPKELGLLREPRYEAKDDRISIALHDTRHEIRFELAAGAEPRPTRVRHRAGSRRSRGLALAD